MGGASLSGWLGVWDSGEREVLSSHIGGIGLVRFILSCWFKKLVTGWFMSLMLLEWVQLLSIWEKLQRPSDTIKGCDCESLCVCVCVCVCVL